MITWVLIDNEDAQAIDIFEWLDPPDGNELGACLFSLPFECVELAEALCEAANRKALEKETRK